MRKLKIVVTGGHPGDPEYGCGGTIAGRNRLNKKPVLHMHHNHLKSFILFKNRYASSVDLNADVSWLNHSFFKCSHKQVCYYQIDNFELNLEVVGGYEF